MYLFIAPTHIVEMTYLRSSAKIARQVGFWIKVKDDPKDKLTDSMAKRRERYGRKVMEMYTIIEMSTRAPHNRRNR